MDPSKRINALTGELTDVEYTFHIVDHRDNNNGTRSYKVRYDGYRDNEDQWLSPELS